MNHDHTRAFVADQLTRLTDHAEWLAALAVAQTFHHYSLTNRLLIWAQCPDASRVAGYQAWQSLGRQVLRGAHGIKILAPLMRRRREDADADEPTVILTGFRTVTVFDISQTDGDPVPSLDPPLLTTATQMTLLAAVIAHSPVPVHFVPDATLHGANGVYHLVDHTIGIAQGLAPDQQLKTLLHELAHHFGVQDAAAPQGWDRGWEECAAESTAYLAAGSIGLDTATYSRDYVASWAATNPAIIHTLVESVSHRLEAVTAIVAAALDTPSAVA